VGLTALAFAPVDAHQRADIIVRQHNCGQRGIAGSAELGDFVVMGAHSGVIGRVKVGNGAQIAGVAHVKNDVEPGARMGNARMSVQRGGTRGSGNQTTWPSVARPRCTLDCSESNAWFLASMASSTLSARRSVSKIA